jgi:type VI secretion system protein ImpJ
VVWSEGLFLQPQHLQQHDRYIEHYIDLRATSIHNFGWGFSQLKLDRDLLKLGRLGVSSAEGVFPDGTPFSIPDDDEPPEPIEIGENIRDEIVHLALPVRRTDAPEIDLEGSGDVLPRLQGQEIDVRDVTGTSAGTTLMQVGGLKTRLMFGSDELGGYATIPLAHVQEAKVDQHVVLDDSFVPTVCAVGAAPVLDAFVKEFEGMLHQRGEALANRVAATGRGGAAEIADFLLLQIVNRLEPLVHHMSEGNTRCHPESFYRLALAAAGELATFSTSSKRPARFAPYRHEDLRASFEPVIAALRQALSSVMEQTATSIPLQQKKYGISVGTVADRNLLSNSQFVLAVNADSPAELIRTQFPAQCKVGPVERIRDLVNLQLPGIRLDALPVAPRQIPYHSGYVYFQLDRTSELWEQLKTSGGVAFHVGGEFPGLQMEFWAIKD